MNIHHIARRKKPVFDRSLLVFVFAIAVQRTHTSIPLYFIGCLHEIYFAINPKDVLLLEPPRRLFVPPQGALPGFEGSS